MTQSKRRGRPAKPLTSVEPVGVALAPRVLAQLTRHAKALRVSRSEIVRMGVEIILDRIRKRGRVAIRQQIDERRRAEREQAAIENRIEENPDTKSQQEGA